MYILVSFCKIIWNNNCLSTTYEYIFICNDEMITSQRTNWSSKIFQKKKWAQSILADVSWMKNALSRDEYSKIMSHKVVFINYLTIWHLLRIGIIVLWERMVTMVFKMPRCFFLVSEIYIDTEIFWRHHTLQSDSAFQ